MLCKRCNAEVPMSEAHEGPSGESLCPRCSRELGGRPMVRYGETVDEHAVSLEEWGGPIDDSQLKPAEAARGASAAAAPRGLGWRTLLVAGIVGSLSAATTFAGLALLFPEKAPRPPAGPETSPPATVSTPQGGGTGQTQPAAAPASPPSSARSAFEESVSKAASALAPDFSNVAKVLEDLKLLESQTTEPAMAKLARDRINAVEKAHDDSVEAEWEKSSARAAEAVGARRYGQALAEFAAFEEKHRGTNFYDTRGASKSRRAREEIDTRWRKDVEAAEAAALKALAAGDFAAARAAYGPLLAFGLDEPKALAERRGAQVERISMLPVAVKVELACWKAWRDAQALVARRDLAGALASLKAAAAADAVNRDRLERDAAFIETASKVLARARENCLKLKGREFSVGEISGKVLIVEKTGFRISSGGTLHAFRLDELAPEVLGRLYALEPEAALGDAKVAEAAMLFALGDLAGAKAAAAAAGASDGRSAALLAIRRAESVGSRYRTAEELLPLIVERAMELKLSEARELFAEFCAGHVRGDALAPRSEALASIAAAIEAGPRVELEASAPTNLGRLTACFRLDDSAATGAVLNALEPEKPLGSAYVSQDGPHATSALSTADGAGGRCMRLGDGFRQVDIILKTLLDAGGGAVEVRFRPSRDLPTGASIIGTSDPNGFHLTVSPQGLILLGFGARVQAQMKPKTGEWASYRVEWDMERKHRAVFVNGALVASDDAADWKAGLPGPLRLNGATNTSTRGRGEAFGDYAGVKTFGKY